MNVVGIEFYQRVGTQFYLFNGGNSAKIERKIEVFNQIAADFKTLEKKYNNLTMSNTLRNGLTIKTGKLILEQYYQLVTDNLDYIYSEENIEQLSSFIIEYMQLSYKIAETDWQTR
jgi:hypothetical protein